MKVSTRKNYQNELFSVASNAKDALIAQWETSDPDNKYFKDNDTLSEEGILPEGIGITSLLLLLEAFGAEEQVFSESDKEKVTNIVNSSLRKLKDFSEDEYSASPILDSVKVFNADGGYTDSVTWCLSSAILARHASVDGKITLDEDVEAYVFDAIARGIDVLCASQSGGRWGFRTDTDSPRSLYFTYSAAASIADFFDYILGEIALLEISSDATSEQKDRAISDAADTEIIDYINKKLNCDICAKVNAARASLQDWIIRDALPLFPKIASCDPLDDDILNVLGMWKHSTVNSGNNGDKVYHHLYYTFYLLDMMVTAGVDERFAEIAEDIEQIRELANYYDAKDRLNDTDMFYFFYDQSFAKEDIESGDYHYENLFSKNVECALYAARAQYADASKTDFWSTAELPLTLSHPNRVINTNLSSVKNFKDPSVVAMALRSNITYSYYVTNTQDIAVERLFDDMCEDIFTPEYRAALLPVEGDSRYDSKMKIYNKMSKSCVENLWDCENYSLALTERSIEALVDFKDYLDKFYKEETPVHTPVPPMPIPGPTSPAKTPFELAIEAKIADYLKSEAGKAAIMEAVGNTPASIKVAAESSSDSISLQSAIDFISLVNKKNRLQYTDEGDKFDTFMSEFGALCEKIVQCNIHKFICDSSSGDPDNSVKNSQQIFKQLKDLASTVTSDSRLLTNKQALILAYAYLMENYNK